MQCDFDTIGTAIVAADIETALVIHDLLRAIGFERFTIRVNNRHVLNGLLERLDLADQSVPGPAGAGQAGQDRPDKVAAEMETTAGSERSAGGSRCSISRH